MAIVAKNGTSGLYLGSTGSPVVYTKIPGVTNFSRGNKIAAELDATDFDSPVGDMEFVNGLSNFEEGSFVVNYDPADTTHLALIAAQGGAARKFRATYNTKYKAFEALIKGVDDPIEVGGIMKMTVTIKRTGADTVTDIS